ncbi:MAG: response regulator transcription factor [Firmicutes bacterium]|jgi:DNA-binding response OmpR family regulator|nr:response regulator transcription factor [Bacillota bacterium]
MNLLLIEDNENIATGLIYAFKKNNHQLMFLTNVEDAKKYLQTNTPALIILDVSLPDGNGFDFYENVIKEKKIPVVFLTAKDDENDIVKGLNLGAEDYMTKPFSTKELLARVDKIILRKKLTKSIKVKNITFDFDKMICFRDNEVIELSSLELKIIHLLFNHVGKVVKRATILDRIWDWTGNDVDDHTVTVYLKRIREKLGTDIITTVKGIGYRIDE